MKTYIILVFSLFHLCCTQKDSNAQPISSGWPQIFDVQISFTGSSVSLSWMADAEPKELYYEVEKSTNGSSFKTVAVVLGGFANEQSFSYLFREKKNLSVKEVYRIIQIKKDGSHRIVAEKSI
jgi:hypothetical protein